MSGLLPELALEDRAGPPADVEGAGAAEAEPLVVGGELGHAGPAVDAQDLGPGGARLLGRPLDERRADALAAVARRREQDLHVELRALGRRDVGVVLAEHDRADRLAAGAERE